jgi:hypothetical protein
VTVSGHSELSQWHVINALHLSFAQRRHPPVAASCQPEKSAAAPCQARLTEKKMNISNELMFLPIFCADAGNPERH